MRGTGVPDWIGHWGIRDITPVMCGWKENFEIKGIQSRIFAEKLKAE